MQAWRLDTIFVTDFHWFNKTVLVGIGPKVLRGANNRIDKRKENK